LLAVAGFPVQLSAQAAPATQPAAAPAATPAAPAAQPAAGSGPTAVPAGATDAATSPAAAADTTALRAPEDFKIEGVEPEAGGLTADATSQRAIAASSDLMQRRAELEQANAKIRQTTIQFFPQLVVRGSYTRLSPVAVEFGQGALVGAQNAGRLEVGACPGGMGQCVLDSAGQPVGAASFEIENLEDNYAVGASLTIPLSDYILRLSDAATSAQASRRAARYSLAAERARVDTDARVLYYNWLRAHGQVYVAQKALERTRARLQDAQAAFSVGSLTQADVMRIEALVANGQLALEQAESLRQLTRAQLAIIMSDMGPADYHVGEAVPPSAVDAPAEGSAHPLIAEAWGKRYELKALDSTIEALENGQSAARAGGYPRIDAVGDATYANPNQRYFPPKQDWNATWSVGVVASWNVGETFLSGARGDELAAQTENLRGQRVRLEALIASQVVSAVLDLRTAQAALQTSEITVRATEEAYRVTADRFRVGRATTTDMVTAETDLLGAKQTQINARIDSAIAGLRLQQALGRSAGTHAAR
jgi:outer membrane protein TolC